MEPPNPTPNSLDPSAPLNLPTSSFSATPSAYVQLPDADSCSRHVPSAVLLHVLEFLPPNDIAYAGRLVCKDAALLLLSHTPHDPPAFVATTKVELLREPLPASMPTQEAAERIAAAFQKLTHFRRLRALSLAVVSGSTTTMSIVWTQLRRCLLPGRTPRQLGEAYSNVRVRPDATHCPDPGTAVCKKGYLHLLPWMLEQGVPLDPARTLAAAARYLRLAGLQAVWRLLSGVYEDLQLNDEVLHAALKSRLPGGRGKVQWILEQGSCQLTEAAAEHAARLGSIKRLMWLQQHGCHVAGMGALVAALRHADTALVQWLIDEAGCALPSDTDTDYGLRFLCWRAAGKGGVAPVRFLLSRGWAAQVWALDAAARHKQLEALKVLVEECGLTPSARTLQGAAGSGSMQTVDWLWLRGCSLSAGAYGEAGACGDLAMVAWLAEEAGCPCDGAALCKLIRDWPRHTRRRGEAPVECRTAVQIVLDSECTAGMELGCSVLAVACEQGDLALVEYLVFERGLLKEALDGRVQECEKEEGQQGVEVFDQVFIGAVRGGCEAVLERLLAVGHPGREAQAKAYGIAYGNGDYGTMRWLRSRGVGCEDGWAGQLRPDGKPQEVPQEVWCGLDGLCPEV